jgi:hypothetical protein
LCAFGFNVCKNARYHRNFYLLNSWVSKKAKLDADLKSIETFPEGEKDKNQNRNTVQVLTERTSANRIAYRHAALLVSPLCGGHRRIALLPAQLSDTNKLHRRGTTGQKDNIGIEGKSDLQG